MLGSMLVFAAPLMRHQNVDNAKTRDLIDETSKENRNLFAHSHQERAGAGSGAVAAG